TVRSFDDDPQSVACTRELKRRYCDNDARWTITKGSVLDEDFIATSGEFDIVYAWGVLHHTGQMWKALEIAAAPVGEDGCLFLMIYLDRGWLSVFWRAVKRFYCAGPLARAIVLALFIPYFMASGLVADILRLRNPVKRYTEYKKRRGMSRFHDWIDWLGGYPYEVAKPEEVIGFYKRRGLELVKHPGMERGYGEYLFKRRARGGTDNAGSRVPLATEPSSPAGG
ncbi:MAG: class I SAM-dependent methyltransferase, partial [bacterium]|nr:class I SAM-dependent methyltransferase [bacterium]